MSYRHSNPTIAIGYVIVFIFFAVLFVGCTVAKQQESTVRFKLTGKESVSTQDGHEYRLYTPVDTYVVKDNLLRGNAHASQTYGSLEPGHTYECKAIGFRMPLISEFKNVTECVEISGL